MILTDDGRKRLKKLMLIQDVNQRTLAQKGWPGTRSHSFVGRLLRGEVSTLEVEPAVRIATFFGVGVDDLFLARTSTKAGRHGTSDVA